MKQQRLQQQHLQFQLLFSQFLQFCGQCQHVWLLYPQRVQPYQQRVQLYEDHGATSKSILNVNVNLKILKFLQYHAQRANEQKLFGTSKLLQGRKRRKKLQISYLKVSLLLKYW